MNLLKIYLLKKLSKLSKLTPHKNAQPDIDKLTKVLHSLNESMDFKQLIMIYENFYHLAINYKFKRLSKNFFVRLEYLLIDTMCSNSEDKASFDLIKTIEETENKYLKASQDEKNIKNYNIIFIIKNLFLSKKMTITDHVLIFIHKMKLSINDVNNGISTEEKYGINNIKKPSLGPNKLESHETIYIQNNESSQFNNTKFNAKRLVKKNNYFSIFLCYF